MENNEKYIFKFIIKKSSIFIYLYRNIVLNVGRIMQYMKESKCYRYLIYVDFIKMLNYLKFK